MTNSEILAIFLKHHRKYTSFKVQGTKTMDRPILVKEAINNNFTWRCTEEGEDYWFILYKKWNKLCIKYRLKGTINLAKFNME